MNQHSLTRTIARLVFYGVAIVLFAWTATLTYSFVANALPTLPWYVPVLSLVVFDAGLLAWMTVFLYFAEGAMQRSVALITCIMDLLGVGLMVLAEILLGGQSWAEIPAGLGEYAIWGIGGWTVFNVAAVVLFHLSSPEARRQMALQAQKDAVLAAAIDNLDSRRIADGGRLAGAIADSLYDELVADLSAGNGKNLPPPRLNGHVKDGGPAARPTPAGAEEEGPGSVEIERAADRRISLEVPDDARPR